ncbi:MAG: hypothetical protein ACE5Q6_09625 [Dehalococcoidia bacterium]
MAVYLTPMVELVVTAGAYTAGDALGASSSFTNLPEGGTIMSAFVVDDDDTPSGSNLELVLFRSSITGTSDNSAFDPTDAEMLTCIGVIAISTHFAFVSNGMSIVDNIALPYWAPEGTLYFQVVDRGGSMTPSATDDIHVGIGVVY